MYKGFFFVFITKNNAPCLVFVFLACVKSAPFCAVKKKEAFFLKNFFHSKKSFFLGGSLEVHPTPLPLWFQDLGGGGQAGCRDVWEQRGDKIRGYWWSVVGFLSES